MGTIAGPGANGAWGVWGRNADPGSSAEPCRESSEHSSYPERPSIWPGVQSHIGGTGEHGGRPTIAIGQGRDPSPYGVTSAYRHCHSDNGSTGYQHSYYATDRHSHGYDSPDRSDRLHCGAYRHGHGYSRAQPYAHPGNHVADGDPRRGGCHADA